MRAALVVVMAAAMSSACAPMYSSYGAGRAGWARRAAPDQAVDLSAIVGRWDNIMMLPKDARLRVLRMDGSQAEGDVVGATIGAVRLLVASGEVHIPAGEVIRVDRVIPSNRRGQILSGVAHGVGLVGFIGLLAGDAPPARLYAAGAIAGAEAGIHAAGPAGPQTIYLAPQARRQ